MLIKRSAIIKEDRNIKTDSKPSGKPEIKCSICGKGHLTIKCYKNRDRKQAYSAEVGVGASRYGCSKGSNLYRKKKHRECRVRVIICPVREIVQVGAVVISAGVDEVMIIAIIS